MACAHPLVIELQRNSFYRWQSPHRGDFGLRSVPCRWCLNCRVDRRNELVDRCKYELCEKLTGAFVTFTYDDAHLYTECPFVETNDGMKPSLDYSHIRKFIDAVRVKIRRWNSKANLKNNVLMNDNFSYLYVGEYGHEPQKSIWNRPHFHVLFFGLDFAACRQIFQDSWKRGFIDSLPILDGGIEYVLKYMDKQVFGDQAFWTYDVNGLARPKSFHSNRLGYNLYFKNLPDIIEHGMTYKIAHNKRRPVPQYVQNVILSSKFKDNLDTYFESRAQTVNEMKTYSLRDFSSQAIASWKTRKAKQRERLLYKKLENNQEIVLPPYLFELYRDSGGYFSPDYEKIKKQSDEVKKFLQDSYISRMRNDLALEALAS